MVPRYDAPPVYLMGEPADAPYRHFTLLRVPVLRVGRTLLARRHPAGLLPARTNVREQSSASETGTAGRRRFQPEHLVDRSIPGDGLGSELALEPSLPFSIGV